jgi:signal transduction histidine kinase
VWCNLILLRDRQTNEPIGYATVSHDLTQQKRTGALRERLLGMVGHDLRNPLSAILMCAELIRRLPALPPAAAKTASRILSSAHRMEGIISDVIDLTKVRLGSGIVIKAAPCDAHLLCARIVEELQVAHPDRELRLSAEGDGQGSWDAARLEQVVSNLVANALQYGPRDAPVIIASRGNDLGWRLSVHNLGDPIAADVLPHIFDPFMRGEPSAGLTEHRRNLGLGLFIVRELVRSHGGNVEVTSRAGEGTRFVVRLPRVAPPQASSASSS